jgi:hypothetical protein
LNGGDARVAASPPGTPANDDGTAGAKTGGGGADPTVTGAGDAADTWAAAAEQEEAEQEEEDYSRRPHPHHHHENQFAAQYHQTALSHGWGDRAMLSPGGGYAHAHGGAMLSVEDALGIEAALGGAAYAGELLALRSALSDKELDMLELQQAHLTLAGKSEETRVKLQRALSAKGEVTRSLEGAGRARDEARGAAEAATEKMGKMRVELAAAREGAAAAREESAAYRDKLEAEQR